MYNKRQIKPPGTYRKCANPKCEIYWEAGFDYCQKCGSLLKAIIIQEDSSEKEAK